MVKDPISNLITSLKNASITGKDTANAPATKNILAILKVLKNNSYIDDYQIIGEEPKKIAQINLKYENGNPAIHDVKRVSKFSQRVYKGFKKIKPTKSGYGNLILSTPDGILTDKEAINKKVGGEALFQIW